MPAASTKPDKASPEAGDAMKQVLQSIEKKVRNLEKRKAKLDGYKEKEDSGSTLEKDQQVAVSKYEEVLQNLDFARDLQKNFQQINTDAEKMMKKQAKREKNERQNMVLKRYQELLMIQNLLDSLGSEKVRGDFQSGKHGAVVLTEDNLNQLDELYKLISPSREGEGSFDTQLNQSAEHALFLIDSREKEVAGTTYKDLKELIDLINNCGYFENAPQDDEETKTKAGDQEFVVVETTEVPQADSAEVQASLPPQVPEDQQVEQNDTNHRQQKQQEFSTPADADSFFSKSTEATMVQQQQNQHTQHKQTTEQDDANNQRPFQEIVSSVQGSFNFLQESTIDMESPHMDPAVVAAHPMPSTQHRHVADSTNLTSQTFSNPGYVQQQQSRDSSHTNVPSELSQQQQMASGPQDFTSQNTFAQSLQNDSLFASSGVEESSQMQQNVLGQTSDTAISQFDMPPPALPMPPGHADPNGQEPTDAQKKEFTMNPNAQMFQSQYYNQQQQQQGENFNQQQNQGGDYNRSGYQGNNNYQQGGFRGNKRGGTGGYRGKDNRDNRGSSNGYGGGRGGGRSGNYMYNNNQDRRNNDRGGFQQGSGFQQRENYRQDNYNSYNGNNNFGGNNSNNNGGGFQKRGGGFNRGNNRGGNSGGGMRGGSGQPRGGPRGGSSNRGNGNTGGFARQNAPAQQEA